MAKDFNQPQIVEHYDQHIRKLIPAYELIHQQIQVLLQLHLSRDTDAEEAHILVVGCGTGHELIHLAKKNPNVRFTAIDIAKNMLEQAEKNVTAQNLQHKINFIHGDTSVLKLLNVKFDAALSILVAHFVPKQLKLSFFDDISQALKPNAICINVDLMQFEQKDGPQRLIQLAEHTGLHPKQTAQMKDKFDEDFSLISIAEMQNIYQQVGFKQQEIFFQIFNYYGLMAYKSA